MTDLKESFISKYKNSGDLTVIKSPSRICPIWVHSDYTKAEE